MCGRYVQSMPAEVLRQLFRTSGPPLNLSPSWNVAPMQSAPVAQRPPETGERRLDLLRWGLLPRWVKDPKDARQPINARAETVATGPMFRQAYAKSRCLVPADAFYEWKAEAGGKQPMAITPSSGDGMAFARIWEHWRGEGEEVVRTFAIVTTDANATMRAVHDRMPVILAPDDWAEWLERDGRPSGAAAVRARRSLAALAGVQGGQLAAEQRPRAAGRAGRDAGRRRPEPGLSGPGHPGMEPAAH